MKNQSRSYIFALLTVMFWSTVASAFKIALRELNNIQLLFLANLTSLLVFFLILLIRRRLPLLRKTSIKALGLSAVQGLLNPFIYYLILFRAYSLLPAQVAQPANFIWPIVLMLLSIPLLKQPLRISGVIALIISFTGVLILATQGHPGSFRIVEPEGFACALLSSLIWALFWIINMKDKRDDLIKLFLSFGFSMIYMTILAFVTGNLHMVPLSAMLPAIYVGIFEMGISFVFWLRALQLSESTGKVANLIYLTPFISLVIIHIVLHESLYFTSVIGLTFIVGGILVSQIKFVKS